MKKHLNAENFLAALREIVVMEKEPINGIMVLNIPAIGNLDYRMDKDSTWTNGAKYIGEFKKIRAGKELILREQTKYGRMQNNEFHERKLFGMMEWLKLLSGKMVT